MKRRENLGRVHGFPPYNVAQDYGHDELKQICRKSPPHFSMKSSMPDVCFRFLNDGGFVIVQ